MKRRGGSSEIRLGNQARPGVIQDIHKEVGMDCVFYKRVRTRVARNEDFIALNEFMGYFESGEFTWVGHGKKGTELAKQIFRESQ